MSFSEPVLSERDLYDFILKIVAYILLYLHTYIHLSKDNVLAKNFMYVLQLNHGFMASLTVKLIKFHSLLNSLMESTFGAVEEK